MANRSMHTLGLSNFSIDEYLEDMNKEFVQMVLPAVTVLAVLIVLGAAGNTLVLYMYTFRMKGGTITRFVQALAVFDLVSCCVAIPGEITDMSKNYTFGSHPLCKLLRTVNTFCCVASGGTLLIVAVDRYKRICRPLEHQIQPKGAVIILCCCTTVSSIISLPAAVLYGSRTVSTDVLSITGTDCAISDLFINTMFPVVYIGVQILLFLVGAATLITLYTLIVRQIFRHARHRQPSTCRKLSSGSHVIHSSRTTSENMAPLISEAPYKSNSHGHKLTASYKSNSHDHKIAIQSPQRTHCKQKITFPMQMTTFKVTECCLPATKTSLHDSMETITQRGLNHDRKNQSDQHETDCLKHKSKTLENSTTNIEETNTDKKLLAVNDYEYAEYNESTRDLQCICLSAEDYIYDKQSNEKPEKVHAYHERGRIEINDKNYNQSYYPSTLTNCSVKISVADFSTDFVGGDEDGSYGMSDSPFVSPKETELCSRLSQDNATLCPLADHSEARKQVFFNKSSSSTISSLKESNTSVNKRSGSKSDIWLDKEYFHKFIRRKSSLHGLVDIKNFALGVYGAGTRRTTLMLFLITAAYVVSFLPYLTLMMLKILDKDSLVGRDGAWHNLLIRSYFFNSVVNPVIYSFFSRNFFRECKKLFSMRFR